MPNNKNERKGKQTGELSAEERFRNFFSTSVIDLPEEMTDLDIFSPFVPSIIPCDVRL